MSNIENFKEIGLDQWKEAIGDGVDGDVHPYRKNYEIKVENALGGYKEAVVEDKAKHSEVTFQNSGTS